MATCPVSDYSSSVSELFILCFNLLVLCFTFTRAIRPLFQIYKGYSYSVSDLQGLLVLCFRFTRATRPLFQIYKGYSSSVSDLQGLLILCFRFTRVVRLLFQIYKAYWSSVSDLQGLLILSDLSQFPRATHPLFQIYKAYWSSVSDLQGLFILCFRFTRATHPLFQLICPLFQIYVTIWKWWYLSVVFCCRVLFLSSFHGSSWLIKVSDLFTLSYPHLFQIRYCSKVSTYNNF